jgi:hypothetical protein
MLAIIIQAGGRFALERITPVRSERELRGWLKPWTRKDVDASFCTDTALTLDFSGPNGERRIDRLYRKLSPWDFEEAHVVGNLPALKASAVRGLHAARVAHELGFPIAETHPRASLAWLGARDSLWRRAVGEYSGSKAAPESARGIPEGIVKERCLDLWTGILEKTGLEDHRAETAWPTSVEIDAVVCALAARAMIVDDASSAVLPFGPSDSLIGAGGSYVLLGRGVTVPTASVSTLPQSSSRSGRPKRAA